MNSIFFLWYVSLVSTTMTWAARSSSDLVLSPNAPNKQESATYYLEKTTQANNLLLSMYDVVINDLKLDILYKTPANDEFHWFYPTSKDSVPGFGNFYHFYILSKTRYHMFYVYKYMEPRQFSFFDNSVSAAHVLDKVSNSLFCSVEFKAKVTMERIESFDILMDMFEGASDDCIVELLDKDIPQADIVGQRECLGNSIEQKECSKDPTSPYRKIFMREDTVSEDFFLHTFGHEFVHLMSYSSDSPRDYLKLDETRKVLVIDEGMTELIHRKIRYHVHKSFPLDSNIQTFTLKPAYDTMISSFTKACGSPQVELFVYDYFVNTIDSIFYIFDKGQHVSELERCYFKNEQCETVGTLIQSFVEKLGFRSIYNLPNTNLDSKSCLLIKGIQNSFTTIHDKCFFPSPDQMGQCRRFSITDTSQ